MSGWDDAKIEQLKILWADGKSLRQIGVALGVSRNAVAGKASRLKLESREPPAALACREYKKAPVFIQPPEMELVEPPYAVSDSRNHYPVGALCSWYAGGVERVSALWKGSHGIRSVDLPNNGAYARWSDVPRCTAARLPGKSLCMFHHHAAYEHDAEYAAKALNHAATRTMKQQGAQSGSLSAW